MSAAVTGINATNALPKPADPRVRTCEIQGDVLVGLQKDEEVFLFFKIVEVKAFKQVMRGKVIAEITTTEAVLAREVQVDAYKRQGHRQRLPMVGVNVGFTHDGLVALIGAKNAANMDPSFMAGAGESAKALGDPLDKGGKPAWIADFTSDTIHGVFLVTGPAKDKFRATSLAEDKAAELERDFGHAIKVVHREVGAVRPERGYEHFGFLDGVSNPGVRGITPRQNPVDDNQGVPGQDLLWPGAFVFDYPGQDPNQPFTTAGPPPAMAHPWMRDGSYMVFRRLKQLVPEFRAFLKSAGKTQGLDPQLLGARMVGRWPSGAPIMLAPLQDDPTLGANILGNNNFEYSQDTAERRCPFGAHIRKTYPRDDLKDPNTAKLKDPEGFVQSHRIMRAGIPFGPEVDEDEDAIAKDRGLLFVCYQTSVVNQFEFVQIRWANAPNFPINKSHPDGSAAVPGHDPVIGQVAGTRTMDEILPNYPAGNMRSTLSMPLPFIEPTAAGYFFVPSITALRETLSR